MSGFVNGFFELTATRARHWHRHRDCGCASLLEIAEQHLVEGFRWQIGRGGNFLIVEGPGIDQGHTSALFEAITGDPRGFPGRPGSAEQRSR